MAVLTERETWPSQLEQKRDVDELCVAFDLQSASGQMTRGHDGECGQQLHPDRFMADRCAGSRQPSARVQISNQIGHLALGKLRPSDVFLLQLPHHHGAMSPQYRHDGDG